MCNVMYVNLKKFGQFDKCVAEIKKLTVYLAKSLLMTNSDHPCLAVILFLRDFALKDRFKSFSCI